MSLDLEAIKAHIELLVEERDHASDDAKRQHAGMREVALFRAANAQGCLGKYAVPLLAEVERLTEEIMGYQVRDGYEKGHEHGQAAAVAEVERLRTLVANMQAHHDYHHDNWMPKS